MPIAVLAGVITVVSVALYELRIGTSSGGPFTVFARGTSEVTNGVLGRFDPSTLANDSYIIRLTAEDSGGHIVTLDQTVNVQSRDHQGSLFDNLFFSSFGWGGDPENSGRLRLSKNNWYNFNMTFRRDRNAFDYNLLANPLNPANDSIQVGSSPHRFDTVRALLTALVSVIVGMVIVHALFLGRFVHRASPLFR